MRRSGVGGVAVYASSSMLGNERCQKLLVSTQSVTDGLAV
jgi:hypothetical protein